MRLNHFVLILAILVAVPIVAQNTQPRMTIMLNGHSAAEFKQAVRDLNESEGVDVLYNQNPVIRFAYTSEENRVEALQLLYSRTYTVTTKDGMPADYPILPTSPTSADIDAFNEQKLEWIEDNPDIYESMQQSGDIIVIPQEEFNQMPPDKQQVILDNPDLYSVE